MATYTLDNMEPDTDDIPDADFERLLTELLREASTETLIVYILGNDSMREEVGELFYADIDRRYSEEQHVENEQDGMEIDDSFPMYLEYDDDNQHGLAAAADIEG